MKFDPAKGRDPVDGFADLAREIQPALPPRKRAAGWQRLAQAMASRRPPGEDQAMAPSSPTRRRRLTSPLALGLALACAAVLAPVVWHFVKVPKPQLLQFTVAGATAGDAGATIGGTLSAQAGPLQLRFTDGSRVSMRAAARMAVAAVSAKGADIRLLDGTIDVDVRHRPDTSWRFVAGPYAVDVKGTSFALGWNATAGRLELRMRSGAGAVLSPASAKPRTLTAGESIFVDEAGNPVSAAAARPSPPAAGTPSAALARAPSSAPALAPPTPSPMAGEAPASPTPRNHKGRDRRGAPVPLAHGEWAPLVARGDFAAIVDEATRIGIDACLAADTETNLSVLADAARYTHRSELARRSLLALRARFPATDHARDAAFFLARLSETTSAGTREALSWYQRYLGEAARGSYAEEALGREMILLHRRGAGEQTSRAARRYLKAYPRGIYAKEAAVWLDTPPGP